MKQKKTLNLVTLLALGIAIATTLYKITTFNILSTKYLLPLYGILFLIFVFCLLASLKSRKNYISILNIILTLALVFASINIDKFQNLVDRFSGSKTETHTIHIIVKNTAPYETFEDVKNLIFAANTNLDAENIEKARLLIKEQEDTDIHIKRYEDYPNLINDFYSDRIEVILLSESNMALMDEIADTFMEDIKIIKSYTYTVDLEEVDNPNVSTETFSVYITGIDTSGPITSTSRSDVNMIMTINPLNHQILLTSIPRDMHVILHTVGKKDKLSHSGVYGAMETVKTVEDFMGIDIDYFLRVNFSSVEKVVDTLGGVEVNSQFSFSSGDYYFKKGKNKLNGKQALRFVRIRKALPGGDNDRVKNQQALLTAIINKSMSPSTLKNYSAFLESISDSFQTNIPAYQVSTLIRNQIDAMPSWEILNYQLAGTIAKSYTTHSMPGIMRVVKELDIETAEKAKELIQKMEENITLTPQDIKAK